jgi:natural product biosynthesis luciferase-like monooxygenase protein
MNHQDSFPIETASDVDQSAQLEGNYVFPASFGQERLWFLRELDVGGMASYHIPFALRIDGPLQLPALQHAINQIVARHESLRTSFAFVDGELRQVISPSATVALPVVDVSDRPEPAQTARIRQLSLDIAQRPFDFEHGPLLRTLLLRLAETRHLLIVVMHHIVSDGWSVDIFLRELAALYAAAVTGRAAALAEPPIQYADFAAWQRDWLHGDVLERLLAYWRDHLRDAPTTLDLPADRPRPELPTYRGATYAFTLSAPLSQALGSLSRQAGATLYMTLLAAFEVLLWRYTGQDQFLIGTPVAGRDRQELEGLIGFFTNTLVLRADLSDDPSFQTLLARVQQDCLGAYAHQDLPFEKLVEELHHARDIRRNPLFQILFALQSTPPQTLTAHDLTLTPLAIDNQTAKFDLSLDMVAADHGLQGTLTYSSDLFDAATIERLAGHFQTLLEAIVADPARPVSTLPLLSAAERQQLLVEWNATELPYPATSIHRLIEEQARRTPDAIAVVCQGEELSYRELNRRANQLAHHLRSLGVGAGPDESRVGICLPRSLELIVGLLGVLKAGGAYVPLDPGYPRERLALMIAEADIAVLLTQQRLAAGLEHQAQVLLLDRQWPGINGYPAADPSVEVLPEQPAYVIYTSGSTGTPKGVVVTHGNVVNFFSAMDQRIAQEGPKVWLALTSISFDISVLELFWTLARGFKVVLQADQAQPMIVPGARNTAAQKTIDFSLFYFANDERSSGQNKYRLLMEGAKFADQHGFAAVWTPERHFHAFGGLYPNPVVTSAALASATERIQIRAGSVVLPLHNPIRIAEEWAVVDNLSHGRVGLSFASGWNANDFVFAPDQYADRKAVMLREIETVRRLWRGESLPFRGGGGNEILVQTLPRPIQPELPVWLTSAGNAETFQAAGEIGANVLTHLLGQTIEELSEKIALYRQAWRAAGHAGEGHVTLMLHTFVSDDLATVREIVRQPFCDYLMSSIDLMRSMAQSIGQDIDAQDFSAEDMQQLVALAFERYFETSGLFGTPESCARMIERLKQIGVDEVACLIDFGIDTDAVLASLDHLNVLRERTSGGSHDDAAISEQIERYQVSHLQCTPSLAQLLAANDEALRAMQSLKVIMIGGEAFPSSVAERLRAALPATIVNMYGPTETTIWSATHTVEQIERTIPIGRPVANTQLYILDRRFQPVPQGVAGELFIGGAGVARGYLGRPELTAERFVPDPFAQRAPDVPGARLYRTGDLARYRADGRIEFLGRTDRQVKIRGHRIEPGEIEALLRQHPAVREAVVVARHEASGDHRLVAYVTEEEQRSQWPVERTKGQAGEDQVARLGSQELRSFLRSRLPEYMLPSAFVVLDALPLLPNGKLDRKALPAPEILRGGIAQAYVEPRNELEAEVAAIWARLLGLERVGVHDNFFDLGGHSLLFVRLVEDIRATFRVELPFRELFLTPTVEHVAMHIALSRKHAPRAIDEDLDLRALVEGISDEEVELLLSDPLIAMQLVESQAQSEDHSG